MYQSTQNNPELFFILVLNWKVLEEIPWTKISKSVNHPSYDQPTICCSNDQSQILASI